MPLEKVPLSIRGRNAETERKGRAFVAAVAKSGAKRMNVGIDFPPQYTQSEAHMDQLIKQR